MEQSRAFAYLTSIEVMDYVIPFCGSAKTSLHNQVFLEGVKSALLGGKGASSGGICKGEVIKGEYRTWTDEERTVGLKALGRVYAGWGFSQAFYREKLFEKTLGFKSLEEFMTGFWEAWALSKGETRRDLFDCRIADEAKTRRICLSWRIRGKQQTVPTRSLTTKTLQRQWKVSRPKL